MHCGVESKAETVHQGKDEAREYGSPHCHEHREVLFGSCLKLSSENLCESAPLSQISNIDFFAIASWNFAQKLAKRPSSVLAVSGLKIDNVRGSSRFILPALSIISYSHSLFDHISRYHEDFRARFVSERGLGFRGTHWPCIA